MITNNGNIIGIMAGNDTFCVSLLSLHAAPKAVNNDAHHNQEKYEINEEPCHQLKGYHIRYAKLVCRDHTGGYVYRSRS